MRRSSRRDPRGQILIVFLLAIVAIVAAVGLVIDGGFAFAQRRAEQNAADLAALAGANALLNGQDATAAALASSEENNFKDGQDGVTVTVTVAPTTVQVNITAPHENYFAGVVGQASWDVSVTATALTGIPTRFMGVAPFILSQEAFDPITGLPFIDFTVPYDFTKTTGSGSDAPITVSNMAWTNLGTGNVSSNDVKDALDGSAPINANLLLNQYVGQHNNGVHNTLFDSNSGASPASTPRWPAWTLPSQSSARPLTVRLIATTRRASATARIRLAASAVGRSSTSSAPKRTAVERTGRSPVTS